MVWFKQIENAKPFTELVDLHFHSLRSLGLKEFLHLVLVFVTILRSLGFFCGTAAATFEQIVRVAKSILVEGKDVSKFFT